MKLCYGWALLQLVMDDGVQDGGSQGRAAMHCIHGFMAGKIPSANLFWRDHRADEAVKWQDVDSSCNESPLLSRPRKNLGRTFCFQTRADEGITPLIFDHVASQLALRLQLRAC